MVRYSGTYLKSPRAGDILVRWFKPMAKRGWKLCLVLEYPPEDKSWLTSLEDLGVCIEYLPRPLGNFDLGCIKRAYSLCKKHEIDVFHCDNIHTSPLLGAYLAKAPVRLWHKRSMNSVYEESRALTLRDRLSFSVRVSSMVATKIVAVSDLVKQELIELGITPSKIEVKINPIDFEVLATEKTRSEVLSDYGFDKDDLIILTMGHSVKVKGWDLLIGAFGQIASSVPRAKLLMAGGVSRPEEIKMYEELKEKIDVLGLIDRVQFTGHLMAIGDVFSSSDVFVFPSRSEGCGNALIEAWASYLPCISTRVGVAPNLIEDGVNGILVDRGDENALANAMLHLLQDAEMRERFVQEIKKSTMLVDYNQYAEKMSEDYALMFKNC